MDNLFSFDPKKHDLLYEDGIIRLYIADHVCIVCAADLEEIAECVGFKVDHYHVEGVPVVQIGDWAPGHWLPDTADLLQFLHGHKGACTLEIESDIVTDHVELVVLAATAGIEVRTVNNELRKRIEHMRAEFDELVKMFETLKRVAA